MSSRITALFKPAAMRSARPLFSASNIRISRCSAGVSALSSSVDGVANALRSADAVGTYSFESLI